MADARTSGTAVTRIFSILQVNNRNEEAGFAYMKKLRQNIQAYTKSGGGGTVPVGLGQAAGGIFFIVDALFTKQKGYDVQISFPKEGIGSAAECIGLVKGNKNGAAGAKTDRLGGQPRHAIAAGAVEDQLPSRPSEGGAGSGSCRDTQAGQDHRDRRPLGRRQPQAHHRPLGGRSLERRLMNASVHTIGPRRRVMPEAWLRSGGLLGIWLLLLIFIVYPLLMLLSRAFFDDGHLSLQALVAAITAPKNLRALGNSLLLAMLVGVAGTLLGLIFAFTVERAGAPRGVSRLIDFFTFLPLISPPFTTSIAFVFSFGPRGLITYELLGIKNVQVYGLTSTFAAETLTYFPIAYLALRPMLASIGTGLEEAAFSLGGSRWHAFRTVTLPLVIRASPTPSCCCSRPRWRISQRR